MFPSLHLSKKDGTELVTNGSAVFKALLIMMWARRISESLKRCPHLDDVLIGVKQEVLIFVLTLHPESPVSCVKEGESQKEPLRRAHLVETSGIRSVQQGCLRN